MHTHPNLINLQLQRNTITCWQNFSQTFPLALTLPWPKLTSRLISRGISHHNVCLVIKLMAHLCPLRDPILEKGTCCLLWIIWGETCKGCYKHSLDFIMWEGRNRMGGCNDLLCNTNETIQPALNFVPPSHLPNRHHASPNISTFHPGAICIVFVWVKLATLKWRWW